MPATIRAWPIMVGAALLLSLAMGIRQSLGLFMQPMTDSGITVADFTFSVAVQNVVWGLSQPFVGALSDRLGLRRVAMSGAVLYAAGILCAVLATGPLWLSLGTGPLLGIALSCTAASLNLSAAARAVPEAQRSRALGIVSAGGSLGTLIAAPLAQGLMASGWQVAMLAMFGLALLMIPAAFVMGRADLVPLPARRGEATSFREVLHAALHRRAFLVMAGAFMVCGLQLVFLTTHLPTYLSMCGMDPMLSAQSLAVIGGFNIAGAYTWGWLGGIYPKHVMLGLLYLLRSAAIAVFFLFPPSPVTTLAFAATMGLLWMGVSPLTAGLVAQMFGLRYMATVTSLAFLSHQVGSFLGAWGGGLILQTLGSYDRAWQVGVLIGLIAGTVQIVFGADGRPRPRLRPAMV
ncbi:MAG: MFS transporter [Acetobacteraceae bacterium]|nr:MFS transporter [Acetobacteraceae bacterium]